MAKLRKGVSYRHLKRAYTRRSKFKKKAFIKANPHSKIVRYDMGSSQETFPVKLRLLARAEVQLRNDCIESARQTSNRVLELKVGKTAYHMKIRVYPHHILRENPLATGAGADRMSTGMQLSFGKPIGSAARVRDGQTIFEVGCAPQHVDTAKLALRRASYKLPCRCQIVVEHGK